MKLKFEEQNRNQLTFGAGVSQFEGFFGQLSFQTSNFLGRGETLTMKLQKGSRAAELPDRLHRAVPLRPPLRSASTYSSAWSTTSAIYTQHSTGGNLVFGFPVATSRACS